MIGYLKGQIAEVSPQGWIVIIVNNVGYRVFLTEKDRSVLQPLKEAEIFTEMIVRETEISLYGFISKQDHLMFTILNEVSGIGPKSALAMISCADSHMLVEAIITENLTVLTKFPGIGKKTAQRIILDLKEKLQKTAGHRSVSSHRGFDSSAERAVIDTVFETLTALGYSDREIISIAPDIEKNQHLSEQEIIKLALRILTQKK